jgi:hypothetical protein
MQGKGYRTSWDSYKGAFRSGYADNEWDDAERRLLLVVSRLELQSRRALHQPQTVTYLFKCPANNQRSRKLSTATLYFIHSEAPRLDRLLSRGAWRPELPT